MPLSHRWQPPVIDVESILKEFFDSHSNLPYSIRVAPSRLLDAGNGVISKGVIPKHRFVSFYPGFYCPPPPIYSVGSASGDFCIRQGEVLENLSAYRINCINNGGILDSSGYPRSSLPFSDGDIINHPPKGKSPNVFPIDFSWKKLITSSKQWSKSSQDLLLKYKNETNKLGQGLWYVDGTSLEPVYLSPEINHPDAGIVIVSLTDIKDDTELLMDYLFNTDSEVPFWYTPVDYSKIQLLPSDNHHPSSNQNVPLR